MYRAGMPFAQEYATDGPGAGGGVRTGALLQLVWPELTKAIAGPPTLELAVNRMGVSDVKSWNVGPGCCGPDMTTLLSRYAEPKSTLNHGALSAWPVQASTVLNAHALRDDAHI